MNHLPRRRIFGWILTIAGVLNPFAAEAKCELPLAMPLETLPGWNGVAWFAPPSEDMRLRTTYDVVETFDRPSVTEGYPGKLDVANVSYLFIDKKFQSVEMNLSDASFEAAISLLTDCYGTPYEKRKVTWWDDGRERLLTWRRNAITVRLVKWENFAASLEISNSDVLWERRQQLHRNE